MIITENEFYTHISDPSLIPSKLRTHSNYMSEIINKNPSAYNFLPKDLQENTKYITKLVESNWMVLEHIAEKYRTDTLLFEIGANHNIKEIAPYFEKYLLDVNFYKLHLRKHAFLVHVIPITFLRDIDIMNDIKFLDSKIYNLSSCSR